MNTSFFSNPIKEFLSKKLEEKLAAIKDPEKILSLQKKYEVSTWIKNASIRAKHIKVTTHSSKFFNTSAKTSCFISDFNKNENHGYLSTSTTSDLKLDATGNASSLDVFKFINLKINENQTVLDLVKEKSKQLSELFEINEEELSEVINNFLNLLPASDSKKQTSMLAKQIYFPVNQKDNFADNSNYHLLTVLFPSSMAFSFNSKVIELSSSENIKRARSAMKKGEHSDIDLVNFYKMTGFKFGGTKPQNVTYLNSRLGGRFRFLSSQPPIFKSKPLFRSFFKSVASIELRRRFELFNKSFSIVAKGNGNIKDSLRCKNNINYIIQYLSFRSNFYKNLPSGWAIDCKGIPFIEKIWLDSYYANEKLNNNEWFDAIIKKSTDWFIRYHKSNFHRESDFIISDNNYLAIKDCFVNKESWLK